MPSITVKRLSTANTMPTITGTVEFERFDSSGIPKESFEVYVNYNTYRLFEGNLGVDESKTPNEWKLRFDSPLFPGTYDVEATVYDVNTNQILASDDSKDELIIIAPPQGTTQDNSFDLRQRYLRLNLLMNSLNTLFGGKNGLSPLPSVHPTQDDQSSTTLMASGKEERSQHPVPKSKDKVVDRANIAQKANLKVVDSAAIVAGVPDIPPPSSADILSQMGEYDAAAQAATEAVRSAPDTAAEAAQFQYSSTPTSSTG
jgi:hypothetical protein